MANTKISALTANTNPSGSEEMVYALNNANGKISLNTMKTFVENNLTWYATTSDLTTWLAWKQDTLVSWTNIRTINGASVVWSWDIIVTWGTWYTAWTWIDITWWAISNTWVTSVNWQTWAVTVSWGWSWWYDCVVAADWTWDYTTIWAAVNAWKKNIFVKNWSYTESAQRDVKTAWNNTLHVTWESYLWVNVTVSQTITITGGSDRFIDMAVPSWFTEFDFYLKNLNFTLDFGWNVSYFFRTWSNEWKFLVEDCWFVYSWWTWNNYLFFGNNIFDITTDSNSYNNTKCNMFNRCVFECSTDATNWFVYVMSSWKIVAENCVFKTSWTWTMSIVWASSWGWYIRHCNIDAYWLYFNSNISILNSRIKITSWWSFYYHSSSTPNDFRCELIENSDFIIDWNLWTAWVVIIWWVCNNCTITISASNLTNFIIWWDLYENRRCCTNTRVNYTWTVDLYCNTFWAYFNTSTLTISKNECSCSWIFMINGWAVTISANYSAITWNIWNWATVTDSWTWNVVANNVA